MLPVRTPSSGEGSGDRRTPPAYVPYPRYIPPRYRPAPPHYCFDAARFASDASKPRYLDVERERLVTRWLSEANDALLSRRERPPRYRQRKSEQWAENFVLSKRSDIDEDDCLTLREFVDKFSLPRVVKIDSDDRPVLLYRVLEAHRRVEAVQVIGKKGKIVGRPLLIPDSYDGWFSTCGCRGGAQASAKGSIAALVRARALALVSPRALSAYRARTLPDGTRGSGSQYERAAARAGTPLRLAGVFADGSRAKSPKYAQLIDPQGNELYVPLNTKSELYEVCPDELAPNDRPEMVEPSPVDSLPQEVTARAHRLPHLLSICRLPARVKLLAGTLPVEMANEIGEDLLLREAFTEPVLVMCTLPDFGSTPSSPTKLHADLRHLHTREMLKLIPLNSNLKVRRTQLGYDSEKRMFLSSRLHKALTFCQLNVDNWIRQITYAESPMKKIEHSPRQDRKFTIQGLKIDTAKLFGKTERRDIPDENEGSIIFLGKNQLENINYDVYSDDDVKDDPKSDSSDNKNGDDSSQKFSNEKMSIFREESAGQKKSKWFKNLKLTRTNDKLEEKIAAIEEKYTEMGDPFDPFGDKHSSIERYQDMAKLIEDKYGNELRKSTGTENCHSYKSLTSSSDMGLSSSSNSNPKKPVLTKSVSVQTGMPDDSGYDEKMSSSNLKGRKNLSVDQINYCSSMESNTSSSRKLKSLDDNMLKKSASKSSTQLERRQRIQPDLIPEKSMVKCESYNQIQSCDNINIFGIGTMYNDNDFVINSKQHSFITEKLCSEFHVKTKKVLSKSTSNLLHPKRSIEIADEGNNSNSMPTKTERSADNEKFNFRRKIDKPRAPTPKNDDDIVEFAEDQSRERIRRSISSIQKRKLPVIEDLPYIQVADAVKASDKNDSDNNSDNIYAEICSPSDHELKFELSKDPVITKVRRDLEKSKSENAFRHIEVVVIEKESNRDDASEVSSDFEDENSIKNEIDSWDRRSNDRTHAIRLEVTSSLDDLDDTRSEDCIKITKASSLNFTRSNFLLERTEAIYDTLK